jgi:hypothetical protein
LGARFAQAEVSHLSLLHQFRHGADGLFDGDVRIDAVLVEQVDMVDPQPSERTFAGIAHVSRTAVDVPSSLSVRATHEAKLRGHPHFVTPATDRLADEFPSASPAIPKARIVHPPTAGMRRKSKTKSEKIPRSLRRRRE